MTWVLMRWACKIKSSWLKWKHIVCWYWLWCNYQVSSNIFAIKRQINVLIFSNKSFAALIDYIFVGIADCCSSNINIDNAFVSCLTNNVSCNAECYRGYIFPSGSTKENYSCQNGTWPPMLSSCKRMLLNFFWFKYMYE